MFLLEMNDEMMDSDDMIWLYIMYNYNYMKKSNFSTRVTRVSRIVKLRLQE